MGRKKAAATVMDDENPSAQAMAASKKNKKKGQKVIDDEEYGIVPEPVESEELNSAVQYAPSNGKHTTGDVQEEEDMGSVGEETALSTKKLKGKNAKKGSAEINGPPATCNVDAEEVSIPGKLKGKKAKKGFKIDDDEFDVTAFEEKSVELPQEALEQMQPKFIGKKGKKSKQDGDDESIVQGEHQNGFESVDTASASKKNKKKSMEKSKGDLFSVLASYDGADDGDEDESSVVGPADVDEAEELVFTGKNKKKGSKGFKTESELDLIVADDGHSSEVLDEIVFSGKKKPKAKKGAKEKQEDEISDVQIVESGAVESGGIESEEEANVITFSGKKKGRKGKKPNQKKQDEDLESSFPETGERETLLDSDLNKALKEEDDNCIVFSGKKKPKDRRSATFTNSAFDAVHTEEEEDVPQPEVAGKPGKKAQEFSEDGGIDLNQPENEDASGIASDDAIHFTGKKKGKKNKKVLMPPEEGPVYVTMSAGDDSKTSGDSQKQEAHEPADEVSHLTDTVGASKKQKKKKKSGRTTQEEDDLDKILAELGEGPAPPKSAPVEETSKPESVEFESANVEVAASVIANGGLEAEGVVESAAAKKKKKKKEKEKEKKAAAAVPADEKTAMEVKEERPEEPKGKFADKKVPKHIREMQERLAKMKEAEEKRKREEEERLRKEEEEQRRLEELERQKEEAKRRKKEREKEKLQKKKQEGKLLSGKQKEEARRLALMREQFLGQSGLPKDEQTAAPKKPKYETKKKKRGPVSTDSGAVEQITEIVDHDNEDQTVCEFNDDQDKKDTALAEVETVEEEPQVELPKEDMEMEEDEEEEDWDAKSWDEADVALPVRSAFAEEEESSVTKRINKRVVGPVPVDTVPEKKHATATEMKPPPMKNYAAVLSAPASSSVAKPAPPVKPVSLPKEPQQVVGESGEESGSEETDSEDENAEAKRRKEVTMKRESRKAEALSKRSAADLRSPICCILGHVDTGKTKLLDCIRRTNVQEGEAGGITQQIGATYFPMDNIRERTKELKADANLRVPGLLVIDTPGHESFTNLRARGSGLCDIAILVVDIMHGLEPQTIESLNLVKMRQTPFVVALNKVDRLYGWKIRPNAPIRVALKQQSKDVQNEFEMRLSQVITELKEQGLNSELYYRNKEVRKYVSIVPTSAISGEGIPDLLMLLVQLTQKMMEERLMYVSEVQCTVLEVKVIEGLGTTIDVVLVNGVLHEGDQIVVCGMQGPIVTTIRALLTPHPMKELRVKGSYQHHKELKAAQGIKITAQGLEHAIAGTQLYVVGPDDDLEDVREEAMQDMKNVMSRIDKSGEGVCVQASTLGSLEALLEFLKSPAVNIPVSGISIGPVHKKDVMRASVMLERKKKEYATILAFDVKVTPEARELAEETGVKIFMADIIYHLFDQFKAYMDNLKEEKKREASEEAVFPCVLKIIPQCVFNKKDPIVLGVDILEGIAKVGTPLCVPSRENIDIGRIASIEVNHKAVDIAKKGQKVAMKIVGSNPEEAQKMFGRHFDLEDELVSHITRRSIDLLKENYREDLSIDEWKLVVKLKNLFKIQ